MTTAIPKTFEPLEIDVSGNRYAEPVTNDHEKHKKLNKIISEAQDKVDGNAMNKIVEVGSWMGANAIEMASYDHTRAIYCVRS